jgi:hypothetical protein
MLSYHKLHAIKCIELLYTISSLMAPWRFPRKFLLREKINSLCWSHLSIYIYHVPFTLISNENHSTMYYEKSHLNMHYFKRNGRHLLWVSYEKSYRSLGIIKGNRFECKISIYAIIKSRRQTFIMSLLNSPRKCSMLIKYAIIMLYMDQFRTQAIVIL